MYAVAGVIVGLFVGLGYKAFDVQISNGDYYREWASRQHMRTLKVPAPRGVITDIHGQELAVTVDVDSVYVNPEQVSNVATTAQALTDVLGIDLSQLELKLASRRAFVWLKRHVHTAQAQQIRKLGLAGIGLRREPRRFYPKRSLASTVIGFAGIDNVGLDGVELSQNELLTGRRVEVPVVRDASGKLMFTQVPAVVSGSAVTLTLDSQIQFIAERALAESVKKNEAKSGGTAIVLDMKGAVLAMANWPTYDPNSPKGASEAGARNHSITDAYEIGSIMKVFTIAAGLDAGVIRPDTVINVERGRYTIGRKIITDTFNDWELDVGGILKRSSNVGAVKVAQRLGAQALYEALRNYGFGAQTGIELPGERSGIVRNYKRWGSSGLSAISFGYDLTATALQVAAAMAAIGSGGVYHVPRIVERVSGGQGKLEYQRTPNSRRVMKQRTARQLTEMLALVFQKGKHGGTARSVDIEGYRAGGKTGTAHKVYNGKYTRTRYLSSFAGLAPIDNPRIAVVVIIDEPAGRHYYGSAVAAPVFGKIVTETLRYQLVPSSKPTQAASQVAVESPAALSGQTDNTTDTVMIDPGVAIEYAKFPAVPPRPDQKLDPVARQETWMVPNFTGLSISRALELATEAGVEIEVEGTGRAVSQHPPPGLAAKPKQARLVFAHVN